MKIHVFFGVLTVVLLVIVIGSRRREAFTFDDVVGMARAMAVSDYMSAVPVLPKELRELNYDQHRDIRAGGTGTRFGAARVYPFKRAFFIPATSSIGRSTSTTKWPTNHSNVFVIRPSFLTMARTYFAREFRIRSATRDFAFTTRSISLFLVPEENLQLSPAELRFVEQGVTDLGTAWDFPHGGIARAVIDPLTHSVHVALLRQRKAVSEEQKDTWNSFARN